MNERKITEIDLNKYIAWAKDKEKKSTCFMSKLFVVAYQVRWLRPFIRKIVLSLEGGQFFTSTLRDIFDKYYSIKIGKYSYGGCFVPGLYPEGTIIGNYCSIASVTSIYRRNHTTRWISQHPFFYKSKGVGLLNEDSIPSVLSNPLVIGNDVWVGSHTIILPGCNKIGDGAIVAAGSVVTRNIEPFTIVGGNPARLIKRRFSDKIECEIRRSQWWNYPLEEVVEYIDYFTSPPVVDNIKQINLDVSLKDRYGINK